MNKMLCIALASAFLATPALAERPVDLDLYWQVVKHAQGQVGAERLIACAPSPLDQSTCYLLGGADPYRWISGYVAKVEADPGFEASLPIRLPGDIGDPAITYVAERDGIALPPLAFVSIENRDAFAKCWEAGKCDIAYGGSCEAGLTKEGDMHFAQPVMPSYFVRLWDGTATLYVNVYYAATHRPSSEGFARAATYLEGLLALPAVEAAAVPIDRPFTPLVPAEIYTQFRDQQKQSPKL